MSVEAEVMAIVSEQLGVALDKLSADTQFGDDLGADSLDLSALIITIEQTFKLRIGAETGGTLRCVRDVTSYLSAHSPLLKGQ